MDPDTWYRKAKSEGYRARSAYKLKQIQDRFDVIGPGDDVLDLGAAPGGWLQVARELTEGSVVGVDLSPIEPIEGVHTIQGDFTDDAVVEKIVEALDGSADVVLSDAAPDLSGVWSMDHARSVDLSRQALSIAKRVLAPGGTFLCKVFQGSEFKAFLDEVDREFRRARGFSPEASRKRSAEMYVLGTGFIAGPVKPGDRLTVDIVDIGSEGDGVARVDDFVLFVPDTSVGDTVEVEVTGVKKRFGFAEKV